MRSSQLFPSRISTNSSGQLEFNNWLMEQIIVIIENTFQVSQNNFQTQKFEDLIIQ